MDLQLPDGTIVQGIPDGLSKAEITNKLIAGGHAKSLASPADVAMADPTKDMSSSERFRAGAGKAFNDLYQGGKQILGINGGQNLSGLITGDTRTALQKEIDETKRLDKPLMDTTGGMAGNIAGNMGAAFIPGVNTLAGGAALGGVLGAAQPTATGESRLQNAEVGAIGGAAVPAASALLRSAKSVAEPLYDAGRRQIMGRLLNRVSGDSAPAVQSRMANAAELIPGSAPTAAEVAESGGVSALQRAASAADPEAYTQRAMQQSSARADALRGIAGTPQDLAQQKGVREMMSAPLYDEAMKAKVPLTISDKKISEIMQRPSLETAWQDAEKMAREAGVTSVTAKGEMNGESLHYLKLALDDQIANAKPGSPSQRLLMGTKQELQNWMEKAIPEYGAARKAFASYSPGVDQHKIGTYLANKLEPALNDFGALGNETGAAYARALRDAPSTLKSATGFGGPTRELSDVMAPSQMNILENIGKDLGRKANAQNLGRGVGSDTMQKLSMSNIGEQSGMPKVVDLVSSLPGVSRATNWVYRDTDQKIREQLAQALLQPKQAAQLMQSARGNPRLAAALRELQRVAIPAGASVPLSYAQQQ